jgi:hypothetical protein
MHRWGQAKAATREGDRQEATDRRGSDMTRDFDHHVYVALVAAARRDRDIRPFCQLHTPSRSVLTLRHDVDRFPPRALALAREEAKICAPATYFFRVKPHVLRERIVRSIVDLGHEIGYHYEDLVDAGGNFEQAWSSFRRNLDRLRTFAPVTSIAMHGRPFSSYDGRDLWDRYDYRSTGVRCEAYLDLDWRTTYYFTDTARMWNARHNIRDHIRNIEALPSPSFGQTNELIEFLSLNTHSAVVSTHPERWTSSHAGWIQVVATDALARLAKSAFARSRRGITSTKA